MERFEGHHTIPISLVGHNIHENVVRVSLTDHKLIHLEQDISGRKIRCFRERTNEILIPTEKYLDEKLNLWKAYFAWHINLPPHLVLKQFECLKKVQNWEEKRVKIDHKESWDIPEALENIIQVQKKRVIYITRENKQFYK